MRYILTILILALFTPASSLSYTLTTYEPINVSQDGYTSYPKITNLEKIILKKTYENEDINSRIERLEKKACSRTYSGADLAWRVDNIMSNIDQSALYNIPSKELSSIEKQVLGRSYAKDTLENRLARLEFQMLGAAQSGKPDERYQTLLTASNHYTNIASSSPLGTTTTSYTSGSGFKGTLQNIFGTMFNMGTVTGYTPPISPYGYNAPYGFNPTSSTYGYYSPNWNTPYGYGLGYGNAGLNRHYRTNTGWYNSQRNAASGCGIHILD